MASFAVLRVLCCLCSADQQMLPAGKVQHCRCPRGRQRDNHHKPDITCPGGGPFRWVGSGTRLPDERAADRGGRAGL
ncbi:hypothetical protein GCM10027570_14250 [Streptomonospora sediminis]